MIRLTTMVCLPPDLEPSKKQRWPIDGQADSKRTLKPISLKTVIARIVSLNPPDA